MVGVGPAPGGRDWGVLCSALAQLFVCGAPVNWKAFDAPYRRRRIALPTYPFTRKRYWLDPSEIRSLEGPLAKVQR
jgi:acyl transferase domain-containing protein